MNQSNSFDAGRVTDGQSEFANGLVEVDVGFDGDTDPLLGEIAASGTVVVLRRGRFRLPLARIGLIVVVKTAASMGRRMSGRDRLVRRVIVAMPMRQRRKNPLDGQQAGKQQCNRALESLRHDRGVPLNKVRSRSSPAARSPVKPVGSEASAFRRIHFGFCEAAHR